MKHIAIAVSSLTLLGTVATASFAYGGYRGFFHGYAVGSHSNEVTTASLLVCTSGEGTGVSLDPMVSALVDSALISQWANQESLEHPPFYAPAAAYHDFTKLLTCLSEHRRKYPSKLSNPDVLSSIEDVVSRFPSE